jgi:hypothetical protein
MHLFAIIAVVVVAVVVILGFATLAKFALDKLQTQQAAQADHYQKKDALFTATEQKFLAALDAAVQGHYRVFGQVRVAGILEVKSGNGSGSWQSAFNRIQSKSFDFVLCDPATLAIVAAIELDDSTHARKDRRERDDKLDGFCRSADLPLIHFKTQAKYDIDAIRRELEEAIGPDKTRSSHTTNKPCPNCGHALDRLEGKEGALAGRPIWRCSRYPDCRTVIPAHM